MKCKYCGGDVTLNDHFCPHCGRPVDQAQRHQKEMQQYENEFEETKQEAINKIAVNSGGGTAVGIRLAMIVALFIALIVIAINMDSYSINQNREKKAAKKNYDSYVEQIEQYIADRDYAALYTFGNKHDLTYNEDFKQYREIFYVAGDLANVIRALQETAFIEKDTRDLYYAENLSKYINEYYDYILSESYKSGAEDPEKIEKVFGETEEELAVLLQKYLELSKEDTDSLEGLSKSRRTVMIEEALDNKIVSVTGVGLSDMNKVELPAIGATQEAEQ